MRVFVFGFHGAKNFGDDIFLDQLVEIFSESKESISDIYVSANHASLPASLRGRVTGVLPKKTYITTYEKYLIYAFYLMFSDYVVFSAGSLFTKLPFKLWRNILSFRNILAPFKRIKAIAYGVSIGPFSSAVDERNCKALAEMFEMIWVRDEMSYDWLKSQEIKNIAFSGDIAFAKLYDKKAWSSKKNNIALCITSASRTNETLYDSDERLIDGISSWINEDLHADNYGSIFIINACGDYKYGDSKISQKLIQGISHNNVVYIDYDGDFDQINDKIKTCSLVISSRMHVGIAGLLSGAHVVQLGYAIKISQYFDSVGVPPDLLVDGNEIDHYSLADWYSEEFVHGRCLSKPCEEKFRAYLTRLETSKKELLDHLV